MITAIPTTKPQDQATSELVHRLRDTTLPEATAGTDATALVGGTTAGFIDQSDKIAGRLPMFIGGVVVLSFLLLMMVFRSHPRPAQGGDHEPAVDRRRLRRRGRGVPVGLGPDR